MKIIASWGNEIIKPTIINDYSDLDRLIENINKSNNSGFPTLFVIRLRGYELSFPIGENFSFLQIAKESGLPPYKMAVDKNNDQGYQTFVLEGTHDTEVPKRYVIPTETVKNIVKEFIMTGKQSSCVQWEDI
jgi:hypothetical protein